jgi:N-methylhydantoinase A/oxoprolinase/acetone carboxylase beta subunit
MLVGIDIGGTFTDIVCVDTDTKKIHLTKVLTNYQNLVEGIVAGLEKTLATVKRPADEIERLVLGTTIATNVVVQRRGAKMSVFATEGFEDTLEIGRLKRRSMYDLFIDVQTPVFLSPKRLRAGVPERLDARGRVLKPLDEDYVAAKIRELRENEGIEAVAVSYLFSYENNAHELRTRDIIKSIYPDMYVSLSSEINPMYREYERTVVTAFDAYMRPAVERGIQAMESRLREFGIVGEIHVMQSRGGVTSTASAAAHPVNLFLSGPAGGVIGGARLAASSSFRNLVTFDIGGTSCDVAVIEDGEPAIRTSGEIAGFPVRVPMVDINTIGAGGGSILRIDTSDSLKVGPHSAGSEPGPICYRRGGKEPTITDASVTLGYINPHRFAGGEFDLDVQGARVALEELGQALGLSAVEAALGAHRIMNVQMAEQVKLITIKRGHDLRQFYLLAFGGAGPLHAGALISMLGMKGCVIPQTPGVLSAYGLLNADIEIERAVNFLKRADAITPAQLEETLTGLRNQCVTAMQKDGVSVGKIGVRYSADLRYMGQSYEITVPLPGVGVDDSTTVRLGEAFDQQYQRMYGHTNPTPLEIVNLRCVAYERVESLEDYRVLPASSGTMGAVHQRPVWFLGEREPLVTDIHSRGDLAPGRTIAGPAIVEQPDTTVLVYPGQFAAVDELNNLVITGVSEAYTS